ncbi:MAG TPA: hypothetical protein VK483_14265 [Chitinophagaceae bacterium]|nr:hypothetical protein [Chitinophagaceae bacterium]
MKQNKDCLKQLFKDKNNCYSLREIATALLIIALFTSWIAQQFFQKNIPEFMFYSFATLIGAGCFGYSIERGAFEEGKNDPHD